MLLKDNLLLEQPALRQAIEVIATEMPELQERIWATLEILLAEICSSPEPETPWASGTLNKNGFPVEFTFASQDASIRYTTEVAGAEVSPSERLSHAQQQLANLGTTQLPKAVISRLHQIQITGSLKWGAWIGVRHRTEGDRYKLYVEVPEPISPAAEAMLKEFFGAEPLLPDNGARLVAIGQELDLSRTEFYFRLQSSQLEYWQVGYLIRRVGLEARQVDLLSLLEEVRGYALTQARPKLPEGVYGFSFSFSSQGEPTVFSLFTFAETLLGTDGQIRQTLLSIAQQKGWDFRRYAALSEPLANWTQKHQHHNAIAFVVAPKGSPGLHISLSPPRGE